MKTEYSKSNLKDNIATASLLAAIVIGMFGTLVNSPDARADQEAVQQLETIVVSAPRVDIKLDTIVVTASRNVNVASN